MRILLIDADSRYPNVALMKLSTYFKDKNAEVQLMKLDLPYYPGREKEVRNIDTSGYDLSFCSIIFPGNKGYVTGENIEFGGTGHDIKKRLTAEIEACECDYSIYPDNDISYGFLTRGCIRKCSFCFVPQKEGRLHQVATIDDIVRHKKVRFMDNNILAFEGHKEILAELVKRKLRVNFCSGLDVRMVDAENSLLLRDLKYEDDYIFAFDNLQHRKILIEKLKLLYWRRPWRIKFFAYCHPDMPISDIMKRITILRELECLPYVMRDIACWDSENREFYIDLASYCNDPRMFKTLPFMEYVYRKRKNKARARKSTDLYYDNI